MGMWNLLLTIGSCMLSEQNCDYLYQLSMIYLYVYKYQFRLCNTILYSTGQEPNSKCVCYPSGETSDDYNKVQVNGALGLHRPMSFEAEFTSEIAKKQAIDVCGTSESCLFDVASTNDVSVGMEAAASVSSFETEKASLSKY